MADAKKRSKSTIIDIAGRSWADLCESSQSSQSQTDLESPAKVVGSNGVSAKGPAAAAVDDDDEDDLYDAVFDTTKKVTAAKAAAPPPPQQHDDLSLTSFMNNVHMVTPVKPETPASTTAVFDEDTICSPFAVTAATAAAEEGPKCGPPASKVQEGCVDKSVLHAKRRLTSECDPVATNPVTPERANKFNKKSTEHMNIHNSEESPKVQLEQETDVSILARRQKQIDFGKNTIGYEKYLEQVPKNERHKEHPKTPPKNLKYTRRAWDGLVRNWRLKLHCWDPNSQNDDDALTTGSSSNLYSLGSMNSLDSGSQASDSRPPTPPTIKRPSEDPSLGKHENVSSPDPVKFKKSRTENK